ncbi:c-type cytochrome [Parerythrobacter aestuarii]|uniref:c-type cytochrome n=1 Tax=Parerythrobacter aestuarii TaxID=3020909 RepID=UPI0024DE3150|nr:cytochrome c [Parerythrobacter aestuarii]
MPRIAAGLVVLLLSACSAQDDAVPKPAAEVPQFERVSADPVEHGKRLASVLGCTGCHETELTGADWTEPGMGVLWTANLTQSAASHPPEELRAMIAEGRRPDRALMDMPSYLFTSMHAGDLDALVAYLTTLEPAGKVHPAPTIGPQLQRMIDDGEWVDSVQDIERKRGKGPPDLGPEHALGRHILRATCVECHGMDLRGSDAPFPDAPARPDLRIVAAYDEADFVKLMRTGEAAGGRKLELMSAVARRRYAEFTDSEISAVYHYLAELGRSDP